MLNPLIFISGFFISLKIYLPRQQFPTFLAPETGFTEDNFPTDQVQRREDGLGIIQTYCIYCALYLYYYYIVMYSEIIIQFTVMQTLTGG